MALRGKQKAFINAYLGEANFNATEAARLAKYKGNDATLGQVGYENLRKPEIKKAIAEFWERDAMSAEEVVSRLSAMARADIGEFVTIHNVKGKKLAVVDLDVVKDQGHLVQEIAYTKYGPRIKLYNAREALKDVARLKGIGERKGPIPNLNIDYGSLSVDQLRRLANGEEPMNVLSGGSS